MTRINFQYVLFNKPYGILCQFSSTDKKKTLADFGRFSKDVYPVGRLDADSEGLVLLTNDGLLKHHLLEPRYCHPRTYLVQVERVPTQETLKQLERGIFIGGKKTLPADVKLLDREPNIPSRPVPIRFRKNIPTAWLKVTLHEGRNRQVRRMTAAVGYPTLRLIRIAIGSLTFGEMKPGESRELSRKEVGQLKQSVRIR